MIDTKKFQRTIEDFTCAHCGRTVTGDGFTNHCPHCLYSRHVDVNPGDRAENCGGLMQPIGLEQKGDEWIVVQRCVKCQATRKCKTRGDDQDAVLTFAKELAHRRTH